MSAVWDTKYGKRRVRRDPPDLAQALDAARDISDDPEQQIEIAASLIGLPVEEVRLEYRRREARPKPQTIAVAGRRAPQLVVVERSPRRRVIVNRPR